MSNWQKGWGKVFQNKICSREWGRGCVTFLLEKGSHIRGLVLNLFFIENGLNISI